MLYICPTFDYELYLGGSSLREIDVLVRPMEQIEDLFSKWDSHFSLFADTCSLLKYQEEGLCEFTIAAEEQLKRVVREGNDVQLHVHPHWINSTYKDSKWDYASEYYRLHSYGSEIESIIIQNRDYLTSLLSEEDCNYKCLAFRAGGFCIQPETEILEILYNNGFRIDSSVCSGRRSFIEPYNFDYRHLSCRTAWPISASSSLETNKAINSDFYEIPVMTSGVIFDKIKLYLAKKDYPEIEQVGKYIHNTQTNDSKPSIVRKMVNLAERFFLDPYLCEFDAMDANRMIAILRPYIDMGKENDVVVSVIGHPKMCNVYWLQEAEEFLKQMNCEYSDDVKIVTLREAYEVLKGADKR